MAKIKTEKYVLDGQEITVAFNCNSQGVFSTNLSYLMAEKLGLDSRLTANSLQELEDIISKAFSDYLKANTSMKLKIGISFGVSGEFAKHPEGEFIKETLPYGNKFEIGGFYDHKRAHFAFGFRVLIEETIDGRVYLHEALPTNEYDYPDRDWQKECDGYITHKSTSENSGEQIIEFSQEALNTLTQIKEQIQKASVFMINLLSQEDISGALTMGATKLLAN
ncbi:hypothetical protein SAMN05192529_13143 [Arachidicoccus rhizosphaerae]|uniref:Uncharacterized protein n=1 Tax=Arachidicoccus rhizosphaerae TaxID=551991 RepID=A0A1H4CGI6_9BACT|nr:hypothetical protein [Arachidicoccus rhizosphaerae]SEA59429.1 hypothetical protein SAMN05192529_13143 [Arachidicoccus rhizosphaerae]